LGIILQEFIGTYLDDYLDGSYHEWRKGEWRFWYPDTRLRFTGNYESGELLSESCWKLNGDTLKVCVIKSIRARKI